MNMETNARITDIISMNPGLITELGRNARIAKNTTAMIRDDRMYFA